MIFFEIFFCAILISLGSKLKNYYPTFSYQEKKMLTKVFWFHMLICCAATPILYYGGDANYYWAHPKNLDFTAVLAALSASASPSNSLLFINFFFSNVLELSFISGMVLYAFLGYWAFIYMILVIKHIIPNYFYLNKIKYFGIPLVPLLFLLPNMHFWSVGVGKDTLCFYGVSIFIYSLTNFPKKILHLIIGATLLFFLRPHVLLFLASGFGLATLLKSKISFFQKLLITVVATFAFIPLLSSVQNVTKIEELNVESIDQFNQTKSKTLLNAGSGVDISSYPYPLKVFTFLFRPLFFDAFNAFSIVSSIENLLLLILFVKFLRNKAYRVLFKINHIVLGSFLFFIIGAFAFAPVMSNLGIMIREKNMLMPAFMIFVIASTYANEVAPRLKKKQQKLV